MAKTIVSFTNEKLPDEPIIISVLSSSFSIGEDMAPIMAEVTALLEEANTPCYYVSDVRKIQIGLDDLLQGTSMASRGSQALLHHPLVKEFLLVTDSKVLEMAGKGLRHDVFGNVNIRVFQSMEAALAYARSQD